MPARASSLAEASISREVTWRGAFALFAQRLNRDCRNWKFHIVLAGVILFLFGQSALVTTSFGAWNRLNAPGLLFLQAWGTVSLVLIVIFGNGYFVGLIAEEKEQGTLGLLKLTGIGPVGILIGLFGSRLLQVLVLFTLQFPFIIWAVTLGGVTAHQVVALFLTLLSTLFLIGNLALFASVVCSNSATANGVCYLFLFVIGASYGFSLLLIDLISKGLIVFPGVEAVQFLCDRFVSLIAMLSPYHRMREIVTTGYAETLLNWQVAAALLLGGMFFRLSVLRFERFTNQTEPVAAAGGITQTAAPASKNGLRKSQRCWDNPYLWREFQFASRGFAGIGQGLLTACVLTVILQLILPLLLSPFGFTDDTILDFQKVLWGFWMFGCSIGVIIVPLAAVASTLTTEIKNQTMGTLFLVGRPPQSILASLVFGRWLNVIQVLGWWLIGIAGFLACNSSGIRGPSFEWPAGTVICILILLSIPLWIYGTLFLGIAGLRLDLIKSTIIKTIAFIGVTQMFPILIGASSGTIQTLSRGDAHEIPWVEIGVAYGVALLTLLLLRPLWFSTLKAIRERLAES